MQYVSTPIAARITGLSTANIREWVLRRDLVPADIPPREKGSPARFGWQALLILRIAVHLRDGFHLELQAHRSALHKLRRDLQGRSFISLWDRRLALLATGQWVLMAAGEGALHEDAVVLSLNPHLVAIRDGLASRTNSQKELFSISTLRERAPLSRARGRVSMLSRHAKQ